MCKMRIGIEPNIGIEELNRLNTCINETLKTLLGTHKCSITQICSEKLSKTWKYWKRVSSISFQHHSEALSKSSGDQGFI